MRAGRPRSQKKSIFRLRSLVIQLFLIITELSVLEATNLVTVIWQFVL